MSEAHSAPKRREPESDLETAYLKAHPAAVLGEDGSPIWNFDRSCDKCQKALAEVVEARQNR